MRQPKLSRLGLDFPRQHVFMTKRRFQIPAGKYPIRVSSILELLKSKEPLDVCWRQLHRTVHAMIFRGVELAPVHCTNDHELIGLCVEVGPLESKSFARPGDRYSVQPNHGAVG